MRDLTLAFGLAGLAAASALASCAVLSADDFPDLNVSASSSSSGGQGGAGGTGTAGGGMGGGGGQVNSCVGCIGMGGGGAGGGDGGCIPFKTPCSTVTNGICNDQETCVDQCADGVKDGDETDVDCGGLTCPTKCAQGQACGGTNNNCMSDICVDGVCCDDQCANTCYACDLPGAVGICIVVPDGMPDSNPSVCNGNEVCKAGGCSTKKKNGETCLMSSECASNQCVDDGTGMGIKICKQATGTPCADNSVCASGNCLANNTCG